MKLSPYLFIALLLLPTSGFAAESDDSVVATPFEALVFDEVAEETQGSYVIWCCTMPDGRLCGVPENGGDCARQCESLCRKKKNKKKNIDDMIGPE